MMNICSTSSYSSTNSEDESSESQDCSVRSKKSDRIKGPWSAEEDRALTRMVERHGPRNWSLISRHIKGRSGKSCRLRWCNQLSPSVEHRPFSPEEDAAILAAHARYGNRWATIARQLPGRTDNAVKNHWNSTLKRRATASGATQHHEEEDEALTALTLAPPGAGGSVGGAAAGNANVGEGGGEPAGFWDAMRDVIAREVRDYVNSTLAADTSSNYNTNYVTNTITDHNDYNNDPSFLSSNINSNPNIGFQFQFH